MQKDKKIIESINFHLRQNKIAEAAEVLEEAENMFPDNFAIRERKAHVCHRQGKYFEAENQYAQLTELDSNKVGCWIGLINALLVQNKIAEAAKVLDEAENMFPDNFTIKERKAHCLLKRKMFKKSALLYKSIEKDFSTIYQFRDYINSLYYNGDFDKADNICERALEKFGKNEVILNQYSSFLIERKEWSRLIELVHRVYFFNSSKKTALFVGNCQANPLSRLADMHNSFSSEYNVIRILPAINIMSIELQEQIKDNILPKIDIFVTQNILNEKFPLKTKNCKNLCKTIIFPTCYFNGYFPDIVYLKKNNQTIKKTPIIDYHSSFVLYCFSEGLSEDSCAQGLLNGSWIGNGFIKNISASFDSLYKREKEWDIKITDYIYSNFKIKKLFHTINHPSSDILCHVANNLFSLLEFQNITFSVVRDFLSNTRWIINKKIANELNMNPNHQLEFKIIGKNMSINEFVKRHYDYYKTADDVVRENIEVCKKRIYNWQK